MLTKLLKDTKKLRILLVLELLAIICLIVYINFTKVENSIMLPSYIFSDYTETGDSLVGASGSWISDTELANSLQTVDIDCWKDWGYCVENVGEIFEGNFLSVSSNLHTIIKWDKSEIITKDETAAGCVEYQITFDRIQKKVTSLRTTKSTSGLCEGVGQEPMALYLGDGYTRLQKIRTQK